MTTTHKDLIERSQQGDTQAFSELIHSYEDKIFNLAFKVCASAPAEAEDIYQETFIMAFKKIQQFRGASDLGTWLFRIASNLCFMRLRKKKREPFVRITDPSQNDSDDTSKGISSETLKDLKDNAEADHKKKELTDAVTNALSELPVDFRLVVTMKDIEELSNEDIAKTLNLSVPAVKSRLHRGRLILRERLGNIFKDH